MKPQNAFSGLRSVRWLLLLAAAFAANVTPAGAHNAIVNTALAVGLNELRGFSVTAVPEPATFALVGIGGLSLILLHRHRK